MSTTPIQIGPFEVDPDTHTLRGPDGEVSLEPKVVAVLVLLARRQGQVVTRSELVDTVWAREYGGDQSLTRAISLLRKAFGERRSGRRYIQTIPKRGYRLVTAPGAHGPRATAGTASPRTGRTAWLFRGAVVLVLAAVVAWFAEGWRPRPDLPASPDPVLAVLPFEYQGSTELDAHLADGLADEVLSALTRSEALSVIAGTSSFRFRDERKNLERLREELSITHLVDGTVRRAPGGLRVGVHLVDAGTGLVLWSDVLVRGDDAFYSIPGEVARAILVALEADPAPAGRGGAAPEPEAYQAYLQARALLRDGTPDNLARAIRLLEHAVEVDPGLAEAWAQLAVALLNILVTEPDTAVFMDPADRRRAVRTAASRALEIDPGLVDARIAEVTIDYRERRIPLEEAEERYRAIVADAPNHPNANMRMGMMLLEVGRVEESYRFFRRSFDLDRYSGLTAGMYAGVLYNSGRWAQAHALIDEMNRLWAMTFLPYSQYASYLQAERYEDARRWIAAARAAQDTGGAFFRPGRSELIETLVTVVDELEEHGTIRDETMAALAAALRAGEVTAFNMLQVYGAVGRFDAAYALIRERNALGDRWFRMAPFRPTLAGLLAQPRVMTLFAESGQLRYWLETGRWPDFCKQPDLPYDCRGVGERALAALEEG